MLFLYYSAVYDHIRLNPMYIEVGGMDSNSTNGHYPLYTEYQNQRGPNVRGANVRRLRTEFESIQTSCHSYNVYEASEEGYNFDLDYQEEPLQLDSEEELFILPTNESDSLDELPMNT